MGGKWTPYTYKIEISRDAVEEQDADYSAVETAKAKVPKDLSKYTPESIAALQEALNAIVPGKKASEQAVVNDWAKAIERAIDGLEEKTIPGQPVPFDKLTDGTYTATVIRSESSQMFPIADTCIVNKKGDSFTVTIRMKSVSNTSQDIVFLGKASDAPNNKALWITHGENEKGVYTFDLLNVPIGEWFDLAAHSSTRNQWYDRQLMIDKDSFKTMAEDADSSSDDSGSDGNKQDSNSKTPTNDGKAEKESEHIADTSKATAAVDNSTALADGVYTPDKFSFSGGSGRGSFTCTKVTVTDGKAYATLVFSSNNYQYVKASGNIYYCDHSTGLSTVTIPVALNQNNTIVAMTTAMSAAHEVTYTMFVYIAGADAQKGGALTNNDKLDEEAPVIPGLEFIDEEKLEYAEYFKVFNYADGIRLLEVDMTMKDDKKAEDKDKTEGEATTELNETTKTNVALHDDEELLAEEAEKAADDEDEKAVKSTADAQAELYKGNVIKYLLVPENVEIPAGLEKEVIVINLPVDSIYTGSDDISKIFEELKIDDLITSQVKEDKDNEDILAAGD